MELSLTGETVGVPRTPESVGNVGLRASLRLRRGPSWVEAPSAPQLGASPVRARAKSLPRATAAVWNEDGQRNGPVAGQRRAVWRSSGAKPRRRSLSRSSSVSSSRSRSRPGSLSLSRSQSQSLEPLGDADDVSASSSRWYAENVNVTDAGPEVIEPRPGTSSAVLDRRPGTQQRRRGARPSTTGDGAGAGSPAAFGDWGFAGDADEPGQELVAGRRQRPRRQPDQPRVHREAVFVPEVSLSPAALRSGGGPVTLVSPSLSPPLGRKWSGGALQHRPAPDQLHFSASTYSERAAALRPVRQPRQQARAKAKSEPRIHKDARHRVRALSALHHRQERSRRAPAALPAERVRILPVARTAKGKRVEDDYEVGRFLGFVGSARIHAGWHLQTGLTVAIKIMPAGGTSDTDLRALNEVRVLSEMQLFPCTYVVSLYDVYESPSEMTCVMNMLKGGRLFHGIINQGELSGVVTQSVMRQVAEAVCYMHGHYVFHRDLRPANLIAHLDEESGAWRLTLTNYGGALVEGFEDVVAGIDRFDVEESECLAPPFLGLTPAEQDVWSMGAMLHVMLVGVPFVPQPAEPLPGVTPEEIDGQTVFYVQRDRRKRVVYGRPGEGPDVTGPAWVNAAEEERDLVCKLLTPHRRERLTAEQVVGHPYFSFYASTRNKPKVITAIKQGDLRRHFDLLATEMITGRLVGMRARMTAAIPMNTFSRSDVTQIRGMLNFAAPDGHVSRGKFLEVMRVVGFGDKLDLDALFDVFARRPEGLRAAASAAPDEAADKQEQKEGKKEEQEEEEEGDGSVMDTREFVCGLGTMLEWQGEEFLVFCLDVYGAGTSHMIDQDSLCCALQIVANHKKLQADGAIKTVAARLRTMLDSEMRCEHDGEINTLELRKCVSDDALLVAVFWDPLWERLRGSLTSFLTDVALTDDDLLPSVG